MDDSPFIQEEVREFLGASGAFDLVGTAGSGEEAIAQYEVLRPDVVLMDIIMPGMDGIDALKAMRAKWPESKIVIGSSLAYDETVRLAKQAGACGVLFKPFDETELIKALQEAAEG